MKRLLLRIEMEETEGAASIETLSAELQEDLRREISPEIISMGLSKVKTWLNAF